MNAFINMVVGWAIIRFAFEPVVKKLWAKYVAPRIK